MPIKMKRSTISAVLALTMVLGGCHSKDDAPSGPTPLVLTAAVYDIDAETSSVWHSGEPFGVYMFADNKTPTAANVRYFADNRGATGYLVPDGNAICFPSDQSQVNVASYYPFDESAAANGHTTIVTASEGMAPDGCVWAKASGASALKPRVQMHLKSMLAQISGRILNNDPATARIVARIEGAPRSARLDILSGKYTEMLDCDSPIGVTVKALEGAFEVSAVIVAGESCEDGSKLVLTALDGAGNELRTYPGVALGELLKLGNERLFEPNTVYKIAGDIDAEGVDLRFTGLSSICILSWASDPDEESGTIIK